MNCSADLWSGVTSRLSGRGSVGVEVLDEESVSAQVGTLLRRLPARFALGGLSLGGIVAMALTRTAPDRVAGLLLAATSARAPTREQRDGWTAELDALNAGGSARASQQRILPALVGSDASEETVQRVLRMADEVGDERLVAQLRLQLSRRDERPGLAEVSVPTTVLAGGSDVVCPVGRHHEIAAAVPTARLVVVPDAPHLLPLTHPGRVADVVDEWWLSLE